MKKNNARQNSARKVRWFGLFMIIFSVFMSGVGVVSAADKECSERTQVGCVLAGECFWEGSVDEGAGKCFDKSIRKSDKDKYSWEPTDCDNNNLDINKKETVTYWSWITKNGVKTKTESEGVLIKEACTQIMSQEREEVIKHICEYSDFLTDVGKTKCRIYNEWQAKIKAEDCLDQVETLWQASLKDKSAREAKSEGLRECNYVSYVDQEYGGAIFDGPGLRGGAQMAQLELSDSISKQRDLKTLIIDWAKFAIEIGLVLAVIAIIWAGFRYITDLGDGSGVEAAKKIILWTIVGIFVILGSYAIVNTVIKARFGSDLAINKTTTQLHI